MPPGTTEGEDMPHDSDRLPCEHTPWHARWWVRGAAAGGVALLLGFACSGDDGASNDEAVARRWVTEAIAGRAAGAWDALHPAVQASTTREAYIACIGRQGGANDAKVTVVESAPGTYTARDGSAHQGVQVVVRATFGASSDQVALWVVDGRVAGADDGDGTCAKRL